MIVTDHQPSPSGAWCRWCGAKSVNGAFGTEASCVPREVPNDSEIRPEPKRREIACEDATTIADRLAALYRERTEAMNHTEPEPIEAPEPQPDYDYGCG